MCGDKALFVACILSLIITDSSSVPKLKTVFQWSKIDFIPDSVEDNIKFDTLKAVPYDFERSRGKT